ncbi:hypothetical protein KAW43_01445 [Candidatus Parcubacteria bacterium]|nr:hypothetical protein [Candidatus Parcubacteria bacterium]
MEEKKEHCKRMVEAAEMDVERKRVAFEGAMEDLAYWKGQLEQVEKEEDDKLWEQNLKEKKEV